MILKKGKTLLNVVNDCTILSRRHDENIAQARPSRTIEDSNDSKIGSLL